MLYCIAGAKVNWRGLAVITYGVSSEIWATLCERYLYSVVKMLETWRLESSYNTAKGTDYQQLIGTRDTLYKICTIVKDLVALNL
jgi:hypothetical protein